MIRGQHKVNVYVCVLKNVIGRHTDPSLDRPSGAPEAIVLQNVIGRHNDHSLRGAPGAHFERFFGVPKSARKRHFWAAELLSFKMC